MRQQTGLVARRSRVMATLTGHVSHYTEEMAPSVQPAGSKACMRSPKGSKFGASVRLPMRRLPTCVVACCALFLANTINIAADLAGMGDAASMLFGLRPYLYVVLFGAGIAFAMVRCRYALIAAV